MKMKRATKQAGVLLMTGSFLMATACGGSKEADQQAAAPAVTTEASASAETAAPTAAKPVEIEFWYGLGGALGDNVKLLIEEFNSSQNEVVVKGVTQGNYTETKQQLQAAIASKKVPAAVLTQDNEWARKGYFVALDDLISGSASFNKEDVVPAFLNQGQVEGKQYFLPLYGTTQVLYYRKDLLEKAGLTTDVFATWESLAAAAAKMAVKEGGQTKVYGWMPMWGRENMIDAVYSKGGKMVSEDGKTLLIDSPEWVETWDQFRKWIHEDKIMGIHSGGQGWEYWYKTIDDVMKGRAAGYTGSSGDQGDLDFSIVGAHPQPGWEGHAAAPVAQAIMAGIPALAPAEQQEAAFKWLSFFMNTSNTARWSINTGYIAVRESALEDAAYKAHVEQNPQAGVPLQQAQTASSLFIDPTGGKIEDALKIAADKVQIENVPAAEALKEAKEAAQKELDKVMGAK